MQPAGTAAPEGPPVPQGPPGLGPPCTHIPRHRHPRPGCGAAPHGVQVKAMQGGGPSSGTGTSPFGAGLKGGGFKPCLNRDLSSCQTNVLPKTSVLGDMRCSQDPKGPRFTPVYEAPPLAEQGHAGNCPAEPVSTPRGFCSNSLIPGTGMEMPN